MYGFDLLQKIPLKAITDIVFGIITIPLQIVTLIFGANIDRFLLMFMGICIYSLCWLIIILLIKLKERRNEKNYHLSAKNKAENEFVSKHSSFNYRKNLLVIYLSTVGFLVSSYIFVLFDFGLICILAMLFFLGMFCVYLNKRRKQNKYQRLLSLCTYDLKEKSYLDRCQAFHFSPNRELKVFYMLAIYHKYQSICEEEGLPKFPHIYDFEFIEDSNNVEK